MSSQLPVASQSVSTSQPDDLGGAMSQTAGQKRKQAEQDYVTRLQGVITTLEDDVNRSKLVYKQKSALLVLLKQELQEKQKSGAVDGSLCRAFEVCIADQEYVLKPYAGNSNILSGALVGARKLLQAVKQYERQRESFQVNFAIISAFVQCMHMHGIYVMLLGMTPLFVVGLACVVWIGHRSCYSESMF